MPQNGDCQCVFKGQTLKYWKKGGTDPEKSVVRGYRPQKGRWREMDGKGQTLKK